MTLEEKLEKAKEIIKENIEDADGGIYDTPNWVGDSMIALYDEDGLTILICYGYEYYEVFGLGEKFKDLKDYYYSLLYK